MQTFLLQGKALMELKDPSFSWWKHKHTNPTNQQKHSFTVSTSESLENCCNIFYTHWNSRAAQEIWHLSSAPASVPDQMVRRKHAAANAEATYVVNEDKHLRPMWGWIPGVKVESNTAATTGRRQERRSATAMLWICGGHMRQILVHPALGMLQTWSTPKQAEAALSRGVGK